jgi:hypothetical protein
MDKADKKGSLLKEQSSMVEILKGKIAKGMIKFAQKTQIEGHQKDIRLFKKA